MIIPELAVAPLEDSGTDLEDELPTPDGSLSTYASKPVLGPTSPGVDLELARALLEIGVLPAMVTPIVDPVVGTSAMPALYPVTPIPVLSVVDSAPVVVASPIRQVGGAQFGISPCRARYRFLAPCLSRPRPRSRRRYGQRMLPDRRLVWVPRPGSQLLLWPNRICRTCLGSAPLTFIRTIRCLLPLHGCWTVCEAVSTA